MGALGGALINGSNSSNLRLAYLTRPAGQRATGFFFNPGAHIEIDHCYYYKTDAGPGGDDCIAYLNVDPALSPAWDLNQVHDCTFYAPHSDTLNDGNGGDSGDDFMRPDKGTGFSFYNNTCVGYSAPYRNGQHQDGVQTLGAATSKSTTTPSRTWSTTPSTATASLAALTTCGSTTT